VTKRYKTGTFFRLNNAVMITLLRAGLPVGTFALLTVPGRTTGRLIETPLIVFPRDSERYLIAPYGVVNWVRNLRAAGGQAALVRGRRSETISTVELAPDQAAPILRDTVRAGPAGLPRPLVRIFRRFWILPYLGVELDGSPDQFRSAAMSHPVFLVDTTK
jgi:hypothetical protein